jgi:hypothetical protein
VAAIILSFNGTPSRELVEALVDKLITLLDAEDDVSYDMEPDVDLEESDEGEIETWSEWHLRNSVRRRQMGTECNDDTKPALAVRPHFWPEPGRLVLRDAGQHGIRQTSRGAMSGHDGTTARPAPVAMKERQARRPLPKNGNVRILLVETKGRGTVKEFL